MPFQRHIELVGDTPTPGPHKLEVVAQHSGSVAKTVVFDGGSWGNSSWKRQRGIEVRYDKLQGVDSENPPKRRIYRLPVRPTDRVHRVVVLYSNIGQTIIEKQHMANNRTLTVVCFAGPILNRTRPHGNAKPPPGAIAPPFRPTNPAVLQNIKQATDLFGVAAAKKAFSDVARNKNQFYNAKRTATMDWQRRTSTPDPAHVLLNMMSPPQQLSAASSVPPASVSSPSSVPWSAHADDIAQIRQTFVDGSEPFLRFDAAVQGIEHIMLCYTDEMVDDLVYNADPFNWPEGEFLPPSIDTTFQLGACCHLFLFFFF